jgi:hypothetical protein
LTCSGSVDACSMRLVLEPPVAEFAALVQPDKLAANGFPQPKEVHVETYTDSTGDPAFKVDVVFPKGTASTKLLSSAVEEMTRWITRTLYAASEGHRFPYVRVRRTTDKPR